MRTPPTGVSMPMPCAYDAGAKLVNAAIPAARIRNFLIDLLLWNAIGLITADKAVGSEVRRLDKFHISGTDA